MLLIKYGKDLLSKKSSWSLSLPDNWFTKFEHKVPVLRIRHKQWITTYRAWWSPYLTTCNWIRSKLNRNRPNLLVKCLKHVYVSEDVRQCRPWKQGIEAVLRAADLVQVGIALHNRTVEEIFGHQYQYLDYLVCFQMKCRLRLNHRRLLSKDKFIWKG